MSGICFLHLDCLWLRTPYSRSGSCPDSFLFYVMFWHAPAEILLPMGTLGHFCAQTIFSPSLTLLPHYSITWFRLLSWWKKGFFVPCLVVPGTTFSFIPTISLAGPSCYGLGERERHWIKNDIRHFPISLPNFYFYVSILTLIYFHLVLILSLQFEDNIFPPFQLVSRFSDV